MQAKAQIAPAERSAVSVCLILVTSNELAPKRRPLLSNWGPRSHGDPFRFEALAKPRRTARLRLLCVWIAVMSWQVRAMYLCTAAAQKRSRPQRSSASAREAMTSAKQEVMRLVGNSGDFGGRSDALTPGVVGQRMPKDPTDRTKKERICRGPASGGRPLRFH